jgi:uncharacterized protein YqgC (DUF456 family)
MTFEQIVGLGVALLVMFVGVAGCLLPGLPGTPLILAGALLHKLWFGPAGAAWWVLVLLATLTALSLGLDYLASIYGAKRFGATWRGAVGAVVGGLVGLFFALPGILLGPFIGAFLFELAGRRHWKEASKAGVGATLGLLVGAAGKLASAVAMIGVFAANVVYRALQ